MFHQAQNFQEDNTFIAESYKEFKSLLKNGGFISCGWDGSANSEAAIKTETRATIRCIVSDNPVKGRKCVYSGNTAKYEVIYAKAY